MSSAIVNAMYNTKLKRKTDLKNVIKGGLLARYLKMKQKLKNHIKQWIFLKRFLTLINKIKKDMNKKITHDQMLRRYSISLAQLKAENDSEKL